MLNFNFLGKNVLVTGASRGIGKAVVTAFAQAGARVAVHYHQQTKAAQQVHQSLVGTGHILVQADLANPVAIEQMVNQAIAELGHIDVLVNNAGIYQEHPLQPTSYEDWQVAWQQTINVNLLGAVNVSYCVAQHMIERHNGRIINVTSRGAFRGEPRATAYAASKAGLNAFSQSLALHLAPHNIFVNAVAPGWVETDMSQATLKSPAGEAIRQQSPLNRVANPEEVAHTILFLASEGAEMLTGAILDVNGASYLR
ncbi:SDR family oxidoreductase [Nostocaceae cyanobacterium CENA357]|uniref:SDR family oxidoreductase n=1 Tax=Atlanticothrix silvestris CENA357 TaxID=1725252 RepID=A0A8J7H787_9CYAN|nr:SDR family oxidoreductase [Atlanticothrix silvestris]MBH8550993.1 SDR family oxidoreductase [Atlanticothrix silvestris CENA357]